MLRKYFVSNTIGRTKSGQNESGMIQTLRYPKLAVGDIIAFERDLYHPLAPVVCVPHHTTTTVTACIHLALGSSSWEGMQGE